MTQSPCRASVIGIADEERLRGKIAEVEILVNASGVAMYPQVNQSLNPDTSFLRSNLVITDTIYHPVETKLKKCLYRSAVKR